MNKVQQFIISSIEELAGKENGDIYRRLFKEMSDKDFKEWFKEYMSNPDDVLNIVIPNGKTNPITVERNLKIAKKYDIDFFKSLIIENEEGKVQSTVETFTVDLNVRVPTQTVEKGVAVSDEKGVNILTGQAKASSKITPPESGILYGLGMVETLKELHRGRGGDEGLQQAILASLANGGEVSMENIANFENGVTSTETLDSYFKAMHIKLFDDL